MRYMVLSLIIISVAFSSIAQLLLKIGMSQPIVNTALTTGDPLGISLSIAKNVWIVGGLSLYFLGALFWLFVLAKVEVSYAYPFVGLGFIFTLVLGKVFLGDHISISRIIGSIFVIIGLIFISSE